MKKDVLKIGTLINDNGKIAVISKVIEIGQLKPEIKYISWRANYEITYADGSVLVMSCKALEGMINNGVVEIYYPTSPLPPSLVLPSTGSHDQQEDSGDGTQEH